MTPSQATALLTAIKGDATANGYRTAGDDKSLAAYLNAVPSSPILIWRPAIGQTEINTAIVGTEFAALTALKQNLLNVMLTGPIDATSPNVQANFSAIFGAGTQTLTNLTTLAKRAATRFEQVFTANGVSAVFGIVIQASDVAAVVRNDDGSSK